MAEYTIDQWVEVATVEATCNQKETAIVNDYAGSIDLGVYTLGAMMRDLEPYIAHETDLIKVAKALKLLAPVLTTISAPPGLSDVHVLVEYLSARLENKEKLQNHRAGIREVASALGVLSTWRTFPPADASVIATAISRLSEGTVFKDQTLTTRLFLFEFTDTLVRKHEKSLRRDMGKEGVVNWINSMALFEKNLSCLVVLFPLYTHISKSWRLDDSQLDQCWDSFIRYFPISIGNPTKDPSVPSQEKLRGLLLDCIISNDHYATKAFERLIDNLDTESDLSANTKKEVFATLISCINNYSPSVIENWTTKIWDALKFEVWNGDNEDFIEGSIKVLTALATASADVVPVLVEDGSLLVAARPYEEWLEVKDPKGLYIMHAATECKTRISDSRRQYLQPSSRILKALASTSPYSFHLVSANVLPALFVLWQDITLESEKKMLIETLNGILESRLQHVKPVTGVDGHYFASEEDFESFDLTRAKGIEAIKGSFAKFQHTLVDVYFGLIPGIKALANSKDADIDTALGAAAIRGLALLYKVPGYLTLSERITVVSEMSEIALNEHCLEELRQHAIEALQKISASDPDVYQKTTLEILTSRLPSSLSSDEVQRATEIASINSILNILVLVSCSMPCLKENDMGRPEFTAGSFWHRNFDATMFKLLWILDKSLEQQGQQLYLQAIIVTIGAGLERFDRALDKARLVLNEPYFHGVGPYTWIVKRLFKLILEQKSTDSGTPYIGISNVPSSNTQFDQRIVDQVGKVAMIALRSPRSRTPHSDHIEKALISAHPCTPFYDFIRVAHKEDTLEARKARLNAQPVPEQPSVIWTLFTHGGNLEAIAETQFELEQGPMDKCMANLLSMYLLAGFYLNDDEVKHGVQNILHFNPGKVASAMMKNATSIQPDGSALGRMSMLWMLQLLVNKYRAFDTAPLHEAMKQQLSACWAKSEIEIRYTLQTLAYLAAASLAALQPKSTALIKLMLEGVADPKYGRFFAMNFKILLAPSHIMNTQNFCNIRLLRYMKAFNLIFEPLRAFWTSGDRKVKDNALVALSGILEYIDAKVYAEKDVATTLLPLVLDGTNIRKSPMVKIVFIKALSNLVSHRPELIEEYLKSVIARMTDRADSDVASRSLALEVLTNIVKKLPAAAITKEKALLTQELNVMLGDPSREVRERAQRCKTALLCLDEPADE